MLEKKVFGFDVRKTVVRFAREKYGREKSALAAPFFWHESEIFRRGRFTPNRKRAEREVQHLGFLGSFLERETCVAGPEIDGQRGFLVSIQIDVIQVRKKHYASFFIGRVLEQQCFRTIWARSLRLKHAEICFFRKFNQRAEVSIFVDQSPPAASLLIPGALADIQLPLRRNLWRVKRQGAGRRHVEIGRASCRGRV